MTEAQLLNKLNNHKTNHILHLLLCIPTAGLWSVIWVLVGVSNAIERGKINRKLGRMQ
jgi:ABC-type polysaccharide transport system permease subunit